MSFVCNSVFCFFSILLNYFKIEVALNVLLPIFPMRYIVITRFDFVEFKRSK